MVSVNKVLLAGYMTGDPESRQAGNATVAHFSIAMNRSWTNKATGQKSEESTFVECEAWAKLGEIAMNYLRKGRPVMVEGRLKQDRWETQDGQKRSKLKVVAENIQFLDSNKSQEGQPAASQPAAQEAAAPAYDADTPF
jgi:single-strand DNA-binding protein